MALTFAAPQSVAAVVPCRVPAPGPSTVSPRSSFTTDARAALAVLLALPVAQRQSRLRRCCGPGPPAGPPVSAKPWEWWGAEAEDWPRLLEELMSDARVLLKEFFGHDAFRPKQEEALRAAISHEDMELYWPTAAGKSLIFQLLAVLAWRRKRGIVIVVEPTIPVMQDQTQQFNRRALAEEAPKACLLGSAQKDERVIKAAVDGEYCLVYMCPESITQKFLEAFVPLHESSRICAFVIDEACYMPLWGHEFRPAFLDLAWLRETYCGVPFMALSGAAPPDRQAFIREHLLLRAPRRSAMPMLRKNLQIESCQGLGDLDKINMILDLLAVDGHQAAVVYVQTKPTARRIRRRLEEQSGKRCLGFALGQIDGDTPPDERAVLNLAFRENRINIMVATDAYGQGIDKPDIDVIVHWEPPLNIETYLNQVGRAGRDGRPSVCRLCWNGQRSWKRMLDNKGFFAQELKEMYEADRQVELKSRLAVLTMASGNRCRWHAILSHYACADELGAAGCGVCDVCTGKIKEKRTPASDGERKLALLVLHALFFAQSHSQGDRAGVVQIAHSGSSRFKHQRSVAMLDALTKLRKDLRSTPTKGEIKKMYERLWESGYVLPCYRGMTEQKKLQWGVELSQTGREAQQQPNCEILLVPESSCRKADTTVPRVRHRLKGQQIRAALQEYRDAENDPEAAENALKHLQSVLDEPHVPAAPPVKAPPVKAKYEDATARLLRKMRRMCPDMQVDHARLSSGEFQCTIAIPSQHLELHGEPSKCKDVSLQHALSACKEMSMRIDLRKKRWILKSMGDRWPQEHVECNVKLGTQAMWQAEIYVAPLETTFVSKHECTHWNHAVISAISNIPGHNLWKSSQEWPRRVVRFEALRPVYLPVHSPASMRSRSPSPHTQGPMANMAMSWTHIGHEASQFAMLPDFRAQARSTSPPQPSPAQLPVQAAARRRPSDFAVGTTSPRASPRAFSPRSTDRSPGISSRPSDFSPGTAVDSDLCSNSDVSRDVLGSPVSGGLLDDPWLGVAVRSPLRSPGRELRDPGRPAQAGPLRRPVPSITSPEWAEQAEEGQPVLPAPQLPALEELFAQNMREQREERKLRQQRKEPRPQMQRPQMQRPQTEQPQTQWPPTDRPQTQRPQMLRSILPSFEESRNNNLCGALVRLEWTLAGHNLNKAAERSLILDETTIAHTSLATEAYEKAITERSGRNLAVLVFPGDFNPVHLGHLLMMQQAVARLERAGYDTLAGWLAPMKGGELLSPDFRLAAARAAVQTETLLEVSPWALRQESTKELEVVDSLRKALIEETGLSSKAAPRVRVVAVCGADDTRKYANLKPQDMLGLVVVPQPGEEEFLLERPLQQVYVAEAPAGKGGKLTSEQLAEAIAGGDVAFVSEALPEGVGRLILSPTREEQQVFERDLSKLLLQVPDSPWPASKLMQKLKAYDHQGTLALLILSDAMAPAMKCHLDLLEKAKDRLEQRGYRVIGMWLSPWNEARVGASGRGTPGLSSEFRLRVAEHLVSSHESVEVSSWEMSAEGKPTAIQVARSCRDTLAATFPNSMEGRQLCVFHACGARDLPVYKNTEQPFRDNLGLVVVPASDEDFLLENPSHLSYLSDDMIDVAQAEGKLLPTLREGNVGAAVQLLGAAAARFVLAPSNGEGNLKADCEKLGVQQCGATLLAKTREDVKGTFQRALGPEGVLKVEDLRKFLQSIDPTLKEKELDQLLSASPKSASGLVAGLEFMDWILNSLQPSGPCRLRLGTPKRSSFNPNLYRTYPTMAAKKMTTDLRHQWIMLREEWSGFLAQRQAEQDAFVEQLLQLLPRQQLDEQLAGFNDPAPSPSRSGGSPQAAQNSSGAQLQPIRSEKMMVFEDFATEAATRMKQFVGESSEDEVSHAVSTSHRKIGSTHSRGKSSVSSEEDERLHSVREFEKRTSALENVLVAVESSHRLRRWFTRIPCGSRFLQHTIAWMHWLASLHEPERRGCCHAILNSSLFCSFCTLVILANVLVILYTANWTMENETFQVPYVVSALDIFFCSVYLMETLLKIRVHKAYFFWNEEAPWNVFDLILVILAVYDLVVFFLEISDGHSANMNFMRSLRIVKVSRILRLVRVIRVFRDLRCMLFSIIWSFSSLFWCLVLIFFVILVFSLLIVQLVTEYIIEQDVADNDPIKDGFLYYFGSVQATMATLYQASTGGVDWRNPYELLAYTGEMSCMAFLFYVAFFEFAVFNVLTGVFVDHAMKVSAADRELALAEQKKKERTEAERLRDTCRIIDADGDGKVA
ncbi:SGS1 [Symbiodinium natans]|uniref:DNA 3'-5' helicase n=1 Tax=Symbiodinium natans TaxID=878477 RepID=A0A812P1R3_9DINO|nr:SGS1 [Symbiodinium natans]